MQPNQSVLNIVGVQIRSIALAPASCCWRATKEVGVWCAKLPLSCGTGSLGGRDPSRASSFEVFGEYGERWGIELLDDEIALAVSGTRYDEGVQGRSCGDVLVWFEEFPVFGFCGRGVESASEVVEFSGLALPANTEFVGIGIAGKVSDSQTVSSCAP